MKIWEKTARKVAEKASNFFNNLFGKFTAWYNSLDSNKKQRFILSCTGIVVFILVLSVVLSIVNGKEADNQEEVQEVNYRIAIPGEEIFLPDEPDFLPGVLLERERRVIWTEEDAALYWQDPLRYGEELWRENIEAAAEEILERVP